MWDNYGFSYVWNYITSVDLNNFDVLFRECAFDVFKQNLFNSVSVNKCLVSYKNYKSMFCFEEYLDLLPIRLRTYLSKLPLFN